MTQNPVSLLENLLESLLWSNFRVVVLLAVVWLAIALFRTRDGAFRHDIWLTAIAGCLLFPLLSASLPAIPLAWLPVAQPEIGEFAAPVTGVGVSAGAAVADPATDTGSGSGADDASPIDLRWMLLATWIVGVVASIGWFAFGVASVVRSESRMRRFPAPAVRRLNDELCAKIGLRRRVSLLEAGAGVSPHTWGVVRPRIALPADACDWSRDQLENVLLHELGHIRRFDWLRLCLMRIAASVYWFNPSIWLAVRECRFEAERACDAFVLRHGGESTDYAEQLLALMALRRKITHIGIALGGGDFARRVRSILASTNEVQAMSRFGTGIVATAIVSGAAVLAACQVTSGQPLEAEVAGQQARDQEISVQPERERAAVRAREEAERAAALAREEAETAAALAREEAELAAALVRAAEVAAVLQREERERAGQVARLEALRAALERPSRSPQERLARLQSLEGQLLERERMIRDLQTSLERTSAELVERERELAQLRTQLEETIPSP